MEYLLRVYHRLFYIISSGHMYYYYIFAYLLTVHHISSLYVIDNIIPDKQCELKSGSSHIHEFCVMLSVHPKNR